CAGLLLVVLAELNFRLLEMPLRRRGAVLSARLLDLQAIPRRDSSVAPAAMDALSVHSAEPTSKV
ncbi:MAG TPA: hypothetical protein VJA19_00400, partial [Pseudomonas sp.]|nr:hypothetical protein [Pseudomonas sp.]